MDRLSRISAEQRADLVAYLDGELPEDRTHEIETVLASSPVAQKDVELLSRTYDLLDELPRPKAPDEFSEKTLATARLEAMRPDVMQSPAVRKARKGAVLAGWTLGLVLLAVISYLTANRWIPRESDLLLEDLPVIERLDEYSEIDNFTFLDRLSRKPQLLRDMRTGGRREAQ
ncbi:MAG: anti-sigma factor family protein [Maioricimonas sp. JB045]|uniref:anti-sigma factor family protein n=1 Tax=Maioricimonas sp. JC845 TaxID=3232138 RepID=UPI00345B1E49